jgi:hypothetical protein
VQGAYPDAQAIPVGCDCAAEQQDAGDQREKVDRQRVRSSDRHDAGD